MMEKKPTIYIAMPCYHHMNVQCRSSVDHARLTCQTAFADLHYAVGDSMISRVRNNQISEFFYKSNAEWFMTLDSDILVHHVTPGDNLFDKLLAHDLDVVGGVYAKKQAGCAFRCASVPTDGHLPTYNEGLIEMQWLSSGCMLMSRHVVKKMIEDNPQLLYHGDGIHLGQPRSALYLPGIAETEQDGQTFRKYLSEDWALCLRIQHARFTIWADTSILLTHIGEFGFNMWAEANTAGKQF